ncbi:MAG TPA: alkaline phosphatase family protein [Candidatus Cybelea sp.]|nr:alkaline phosphatase family protein [Candidatus Cybelea sp.]
MKNRAFIPCICAIVASVAVSGCGGTSGSLLKNGRSGQPASQSSPSPIQHVVIVVQENRTFNDFFATFPGADGTTTGRIAKDAACGIPKPETIPLTKAPLITNRDFVHIYKGFETARNHGKDDGFDRASGQGGPECTAPYQYTDPLQIQPYWDMAEQYTLAEHMFTTQGDSSFTAHQDLIAGGTLLPSSNKALVNFPSCGGNCFWGCDAQPSTTKTSLITLDNKWIPYINKGPFPCMTYETIATLLDNQGISWRYYVPPASKNFGKILSAFDAIHDVRYGPDWKNVVSPETQVLSDAAHGQLASVSWVIPDGPDSDHPGKGTDRGPSWVASVVNAIGESTYWNSTAIIIIWDDWGGLYDNLDPPQMGYGGLGFRVPAIIVSPYARAGYISTTQYEFGSILKFVEDNWNLGSLGTSDARAASIIDCFDYYQAPIQFKPIVSQYDQAYFLHKQPSYAPPDSDF